MLELAAQYWATGAVTGTDLWTVGIAALTAGLNSPSTLTFTHTGSTGQAAVQVPLLDIGGTDAGISRLAGGSLAIGNGTAGDYSGTLTANNHAAPSLVAADSGNTTSSGTLTMTAPWWNGSASVADGFTMQVKNLGGQSQLQFNHFGPNTNLLITYGAIEVVYEGIAIFEGGFETTSGQVALFEGPTTLSAVGSATSGANQNSNQLNLYSSFWNGSASQSNQVALTSVLGSGTNAPATVVWSIGGQAGSALNGESWPSGSVIGWSANANGNATMEAIRELKRSRGHSAARLVDGASEVHNMVLARFLREEGRDFWNWSAGNRV